MTIRRLTPDENEMLCVRRDNLEKFLEERMPVLADFMERLGLTNPALVLVEAESYLPALDTWLKEQVISPDDRIWLLTRVGYFIGEFLVQRLGGYWFLNEAPDSRYFGHYVVGCFSRAPNSHALVDPFAIADICVAEPPGRSLADLLARVESEFATA